MIFSCISDEYPALARVMATTEFSSRLGDRQGRERMIGVRWDGGQAQHGGFICVLPTQYSSCFCVLPFRATDKYFYCLCH